MNLQFVPKGIELVQQAIAADNDKDYEKAYGLYKQSLDHFLLALKYEKNKTAKEIIQKRVEGYMERAEMLKKVLQDQKDNPKRQAAAAAEGGGGGGGGGSGAADKDKAKLRGALAGAIVKEKPNVKWTDARQTSATSSRIYSLVRMNPHYRAVLPAIPWPARWRACSGPNRRSRKP